MQKIIGIYNANGSLLGEMRYVFDKVFLKKHCALCDITHGMSYKAKTTWLELMYAEKNGQKYLVN